MEILHVSAECYPVAKAGGLGDVVGALPKYQAKAGDHAKVIMPMYRTRFLYQHHFEVVHKGVSNLADWFFDFTIIREKNNQLGFELYLVDIYGLLDREQVYGYDDDAQRFTAFQIAVLDWLRSWSHQPDIVHVHDHHTALIPFMMQHCYRYASLRNIPTVLTVHNAQYQGWMDMSKTQYIPAWDPWKRGLLEWNGNLNPLASGLRCAWKVTTVSTSYLEELKSNSNGLEHLFISEASKSVGILNGIDTAVWNPAADKYLQHDYSSQTVTEGKAKNKKLLCETFGLDSQKPLIIFIGRLVEEKAADLLAKAIADAFHHIGRRMNFLILGSGDPQVESDLNRLLSLSQHDYACYIGYNESLSHLMYAGADFLLMPSRVEPCGLNQMYALRYGTVPMVRRTGGLKDTVRDIGEQDGFGIMFDDASTGAITHAVWRACEMYPNETHMHHVRKQMMSIDNSWQHSIQQYAALYKSVGVITS